MTDSEKPSAIDIIVDRLRSELQHQILFNDELRRKHDLEMKRASTFALSCFVAALGVGWVGAAITMPAMPKQEKCEVFTVAQKPVTAFVLKPPVLEPSPVVDAPKCPPVPVCEPVKHEETVDNATPTDDHKPSRHRHHRVRRYWH
jgi:hypothetical protein